MSFYRDCNYVNQTVPISLTGESTIRRSVGCPNCMKDKVDNIIILGEYMMSKLFFLLAWTTVTITSLIYLDPFLSVEEFNLSWPAGYISPYVGMEILTYIIEGTFLTENFLRYCSIAV